jgi:hypothetical protein
MNMIKELVLKEMVCTNCFQKRYCPKTEELRPGCFVHIMGMVTIPVEKERY